MKDMKWTEHLSVISSVASITGVSLVWLQALTKEASFMTALFGGVASVAGALVSIGTLVVAFQLIVAGHSFLKPRFSAAVPAYWLFASAAVIWGVFLFQMIIWWFVREAWATRF
ncbi:hypothetical protein [Pseudomonas sp. DWRC2-2]|uniref:hypothetical protein n=1 Tax=Pseudomonas sp. DWRC2-2 TaxID=2804567 RepID=UPI003CF1A7D2